MDTFFTTQWIEENLNHLKKWQKTAYESFKTMIGSEGSDYPCIFATKAFLSKAIRFSFLPDLRNDSSDKLATILQQYGQVSKKTGRYASLICFFETPQNIVETYSISNYEDLFWSILSKVAQEDKKAWPKEISSNPLDPSWEFCFQGEPYFSLCATPAHKIRKSRYFPCFMISFQPRWVFKDINGSTPLGKTMKLKIRDRLEDYDDIAIHPALNWYGEKNNLEWKQYFLGDNNLSPSKCPFSPKRKH